MLLETNGDTRGTYNAFFNDLNNAAKRQAIRNLTNYGDNCPCPSGCSAVPIRVVGIGNGSAGGYHHGYTSNYEYAKTKVGAPSLWGIELKMRTLEANTNVNHFYAKYSQFKASDKWYVWVFATPAAISWESRTLSMSKQSPVFVENAPGGQNGVYDQIYETSKGDLKWEETGNEYNYWFHKQDAYPYNGTDCFIPTPSAAGILSPYFNIDNNTQFYQSWPRTIEGATTLFDRVYLPEKNQPHVQITTENKQWFLDEIRGSRMKCQVLASFNNASGTGTENVGNVIIPVRLDYPAYETVTLEYDVKAATASQGSDYTLTPSSGILVFNAGATEPNEELVINVIDDPVVENDEYVTIELKNPVNAELGSITEYTYTIENDDQDITDPTITIATPTSASTYNATSSVVTIGGNATDNVGVAEVTYLLTGATNGSGVASGTNSWTIPNLLIGLGTTVVTVTATDAVGNTGTDQITITYSTSRLYVDGPYVQTDRGGVSGNGSTWNESFGTIQEAIDFAVTLSPSVTNPIEIWVADGTYYPEKEANSGDARSKTFWLEEYVGIYGHFQGNSRSGGGETDLTQRDLANTSYQTITSGDLGVVGDATDNAYHVFVAFEGDGVPKHFTMDGLTITDGNCNNVVFPPYPRGDEGGGLQCSILGMHSITISNCTFSNNMGYGGSAISALSCGEITINNSIVKDNESNGSAVSIGSNTKYVSITECTFQDNIGNWGAALEIANMAGVTTNTGYIVDRCSFVNNTSTSLGGAISVAGYYATTHENRISRCMFYNNETAIVGGAIFLQGDNPHADRALLCINDCVFSQNSAQSGGAIANLMAESTGAQPALKILSCSFNQNTATSFGGAIYNNPGSGAVSCTPLIGNSIIWNQTAGGEIYNASVAAPIIYNCDIKGGATGTQVIDIDPLFINPADPLGGGLKLQTTPVASNCINVGNNGLVPTWATTDITGNYARVQNSIVDLGAYENTLP